MALAVLIFSTFVEATALAQDIDKISLHIPGSKGGGFDRTGMAIREALLAEGLVKEVDIIRSPGAGGLIGLAQFAESRKSPSTSVFVGGHSNIGAALHNRSNISLTDLVKPHSYVPLHDIVSGTGGRIPNA
jgi:putative tricarboxylic transport membrane protein